ncbi:MAG: cobyrinate a,c-diamide synthase, partial [Lachnospiraceae bacterium]|nr:cobyrinate a,c-diamide synthase [Lachnospiraceae bacterium]
MRRFMIASDSSGSGKTMITTALLQAFKDRGYSVGAVKCGPDYIDPMFHRSVQDVRSRNIDPFLMGNEAAKQVLSAFESEDIVIMEAAMGYYDGIAGTTAASAYEVSVLTDTPVILVINPGSQGNTIAAKLSGLQNFRKNCNIAGVILNRCRKERYEYYRKIIERENSLPVFGYLEELPDAAMESRHLGLMSPSEIEGYREKLNKITTEIIKTVDLDGILKVSKVTEGRFFCHNSGSVRCRIAVAKDEAFSFYYENALEKLRQLGAELCFFSPIRDKALPEDTDALYLGGGYPELHLEELSRNEAIRGQIAVSVKGGMPTIAECGGFIYLQETIEDREGHPYRGCGVFPGKTAYAGRSVRFGYCMMRAETNSMLFNKGEEIPAHEFHHWDT